MTTAVAPQQHPPDDHHPRRRVMAARSNVYVSRRSKAPMDAFRQAQEITAEIRVFYPETPGRPAHPKNLAAAVDELDRAYEEARAELLRRYREVLGLP